MTKAEQTFEQQLAAEGKVQLAEDSSLHSEVKGWVSTQCAILDYAIGRPGVPQGRVTRIVGDEASGKSVLGYHLLKETQDMGGIAVLIDSEQRFSEDFAQRIGLDLGKLFIPQEWETLEQIFAGIRWLVDEVKERAPERAVTIVWDSIGGAPTESQIKGEYHPGIHARVVSEQLRVLHNNHIPKSRVALVIVNQLRDRMDFGGSPWSKDRKTEIAEGPLKYWSTIKIHTKQVSVIGERQEPSGIKVRATVQKNTLAPPFRVAEFEIDFLKGINRLDAQLEVAKRIGVVKLDGSWLTCEGFEKKFHAVGFADVLAAVPGLEEQIKQAPLKWRNGTA